MNKKVTLEELDVNNWLKICDLSVSDEQKEFFSIPSVYWIGISRYELKNKLFAIKADDDYVGFIGAGFYEDGVLGDIDPIMIDYHYQGKGYGKAAMLLIIDYMRNILEVPAINISYRKENTVAEKLYESFGFKVFGGNETNTWRTLKLDK